jgi:hypothetical protein
MAEGYAEMYQRVVKAGASAWFLTANDEMGGGTERVIDALKDRIDVVVRTAPFQIGFLPDLVERLERSRPEAEEVPAQITFDEDSLKRARDAIRTIQVPDHVLDELGFFLGQLDFCALASDRLDYKNKETLHLAGKSIKPLCDSCPLFKSEPTILCTQTENGVSARTYMAIVHYAKALAWFRGRNTVDREDVKQLVPWILHDKLRINSSSPAFKTTHDVRRFDRVSWIQGMFVWSGKCLDLYTSDPKDPDTLRRRVMKLKRDQDKYLSSKDPEARTTAEIDARLTEISTLITQLLGRARTVPVYQDVILLKQLWARYEAQRRNLGRGP